MRYVTFLMLTLSSFAAPLYAQDATLTATAYQTVNVRSGPSTQFDIVGKLEEGDEAAVLGRDSAATRWLYIALPDDETRGWVAVFTVTVNGSVESLEIVEVPSPEDSLDGPAPEGVSVVAVGRVNVRSGPSITYAVIGQLDIEDEALVTARSNYNSDWLFIEGETLSGWVAYFTVTVRGNANDLPVLIPDAATGDLVPPSALIRSSFNVRLHSRPAFAASVTGELPFNTLVTPLGVSPDGRWLYVANDDVEGWGWTRLFEISAEQLAQVPPRAVNGTATPTPRAALTPTPASSG